ncbi:nucleotidyltransferase domain-containing protein [Flavobacterium sp.]|uniref:nucleotidyltransferase domain-containing protein n=1 Tax=Flavobacterium sp. TaxID=239 RepID=UPI003F6A50D6
MFGLYPNSFKEIISIFQKYESIEKVIIYGSRAKGNHKEGSDIDLILFGTIKHNELMQLLNELDESYIPYLFDISIYNELQSESLIEHVNRVGKIFYQKTEINSE